VAAAGGKVYTQSDTQPYVFSAGSISPDTAPARDVQL
jgi:hypothetical protein